jgi:tetratricopeptide (TPR) repeat protein
VTTAPPAADAARLAAEAYGLLGTEPRRGRTLALEALRSARAARRSDAAASALVVLGMAELELGSSATAVPALRRAIAAARRSGQPQLEAEARMSLAFALTASGDGTGALRHARQALAAAGDRGTGRLHMRWAVIMERLGRFDDAFAGYRRGLAALRAAEDGDGVARALCDRGVLHAYRGNLAAAEADLREAQQISDGLGRDLMSATVRANLGFVALRGGDIVAALAHYDAAEPTLAASSGARHSVLELDRSEALLAAGLAVEARDHATRAADALARVGMEAEAAEARLLIAEASLAAGDWAAARASAEHAERSFRRQRRSGWALLARHAAIRGAWRAGPPSAELATRARRAASGLSRAGWEVAALDARVVAARVELERGERAAARRDLRRAARARTRGPVAVRLRAWHAEALGRSADGDRRAARRAVQAGLRVLEEHRATLGATELRAHAADHGSELAALGLRLALAAGRADEALGAAERCKSAALRAPPARPPSEPGMAELLAELRRVALDADTALRDGLPDDGLTRAQARLESQVRRAALRSGAGETRRAQRPAGGRELRAALGPERALVEFVRDGDRLHAVVATAERAWLVGLAAVAEIEFEARALAFALRRIGTAGQPSRSHAVHERNARHAAGRLDALLFGPLRHRLADRELVLVPTGPLHALPWAALPTCAGRPVSIAPSGTLWRRARAAGPAGPATAVIAGPGLEHAAREVAEVAGLYGGSVRLDPAAATAARVRAALEASATAHIACHASFRADNPLFSALALADGPLTVYDLEALRAAPVRLVLSGCDTGLSAVRPGDELMGFAAALLGVGTGVVVASVVPIPDAESRELMVAFHRRLLQGVPPARALADAGTALDPSLPRAHVARAGFVCIGAG